MHGAVYNAEGVHQGQVGKGFSNFYEVYFSHIFDAYLAVNLKDQMEMEYKLRKILKGEADEEVSAASR